MNALVCFVPFVMHLFDTARCLEAFDLRQCQIYHSKFPTLYRYSFTVDSEHSGHTGHTEHTEHTEHTGHTEHWTH